MSDHFDCALGSPRSTRMKYVMKTEIDNAILGICIAAEITLIYIGIQDEDFIALNMLIIY